MTTSGIASMCDLMVKYGLTKLQDGDVLLERPAGLAFAEAAAKTEPAKPGEEPEDDLDRIKRMDPNAQDAALLLGTLKP